MNTRRTFLKTAGLAAVTTGLIDWEILARAAASGSLIINDAKIIRVRDRKNGNTDTYLEVTSESGLKGYAGPLLKEQVAAFPPNLRQRLAGRDAADPKKLNFNTLWAEAFPGKSLEHYTEGKDPLDRTPVWGIQRKSRQTETGWLAALPRKSQSARSTALQAVITQPVSVCRLLRWMPHTGVRSRGSLPSV